MHSRNKRILGLGALCFLILLTLLVAQCSKPWNDVKDNHFIQILGPWGGDNRQKEVLIESELLPVGMSRADWVSAIKEHEFLVDPNEEKCNWGGSGELLFLRNYDSCAFRVVGSKSCAYVYIIAAKFEGEKLVRTAGTFSEYICL